MARLWSNRTPALIVSRSPNVMASLANAAAVTNTPPCLEGSLRDGLEWLAVPVIVTLTPVGMTIGAVVARRVRSARPLSIGDRRPEHAGW